MDLIRQVALVSDTRSVRLRDLSRVSAALQRQASRDVAPIWGVNATVDSFESLEDVPLGYWPVIVVEDVQGAAGVHLDKDGQPFALVEVGQSWSLTASHETIEMLVDPFGNRTVPGASPKAGQGRVEFLVEACDPCESEACAYTVNGVLVSDFYTPQYFDPEAAPGVRYDFRGEIDEPRKVLRGGYLSWHEPVSDHWWQETWFGAKPAYRDLGVFDASDARSVREIVDSQTPEMRQIGQLAANNPAVTAARASASRTEHSASAKADAWRDQIKGLRLAIEHRRGLARSKPRGRRG
jgi:hypothetical protein